MGGRPFDGFLYQRYLARAEQLLVDFNRKMAVMGAHESPFCKEGCAHCCNQTFFASSTEIDVIVARLLRDEARLARFVERAAQRERQLAAHAGLFSACEDRGEQGGRAAIDFMRLRVPCALLADDRCLVYEVRPMACASFVSIVPPRICADNPKGSLSAAMNQLLFETRQALKRLAKSAGVVQTECLDISRQVLRRLAETGKLAPPRQERSQTR